MKFNDFDFFKSLKGLLCFICGKLKGESCQKKKKGEEAKKLQKQTTKYHKYNYDLFIIKNVAKFG